MNIFAPILSVMPRVWNTKGSRLLCANDGQANTDRTGATLSSGRDPSVSKRAFELATSSKNGRRPGGRSTRVCANKPPGWCCDVGVEHLFTNCGAKASLKGALRRLTPMYGVRSSK